MHRLIFWLALLATAGPVGAAERKFDFSGAPLGQFPPGCVSILAGLGKPGDWQVISDEVPLSFQMFTNSPMMGKQSVVAQLATDQTDEHFPLLLLGNESYGDFTLTTRFKTVAGATEQMAGIAFRVQDEKTFYVVRASSLGNNLRFYKVVNGERGPIVGPDVPVPAKVWHTLEVECKGNQIRCLLDGQELIHPLTDKVPLGPGKIAYWTKSDSVSYFTDTRVVYTPAEPLVQGWVRQLMAAYPHLLGLQIFMIPPKLNEPRLVASDKPAEIGQPGRKSDTDVIGTGAVYYDLQEDTFMVAMPLRDRNGDPRASVRVKMKSFKGITEQTAIERALPVVKRLQALVPASNDWNE